MITVGLLATLEAKPEHAQEVADLLASAQQLAQQEDGTVVWFAFQTGPTSFGIFDAFPTDAARQAHLDGQIAAALMAIAGEKLSSPPDIKAVDILARKITLDS
jgi:quinol monooxygenase YgiN